MNDSSLALGSNGSSVFLPSILKQGAYAGQQYCLQISSTDLLAYRTDVFKANHLKPPVTTADVIADAKLLNGKKGMAASASSGNAPAPSPTHELAARRTRHLVVQPSAPHAERREGTQAITFYQQQRSTRRAASSKLPRRRGGPRPRRGKRRWSS